MNDDTLCWMSATELARRYRSRDISPVEVVDATLERLERVNSTVNAFVTVTAATAREQAIQAERDFASSDHTALGALHGIPITIKDLTDTAGVRTTYGCQGLADHVPEHDAASYARIKAAGAILIGKTTTPDFGMLGVTRSSLTGTTNNPWDPTRTAGGSSGGAAAALASGIAPLAWGSDGGGSIRVPASVCGVVGLKVSPGRIPRAGDGGIFDTVGTPGPMARSTEDVALLYSVTQGFHPRDPLSLPRVSEGEIMSAVHGPSLRGLRVAYSPMLGASWVSPEVRAVVDRAARLFATDLGADVEEVTVELPDPIEYFKNIWGIAMVDFYDEMKSAQRWDPDQLDPQILSYVAAGRAVTAQMYHRALHHTRADIVRGFTTIFDRFDILLSPTTPVTAFRHEDESTVFSVPDNGNWNDQDLQFHALTESPSHAALPAISVPCGFSEGLPVGLQIITPWQNDNLALRAAAAYEEATSWRKSRPPLDGAVPTPLS
ncbi:amidase [Rhodococcus sp. NPDC056960]|uniref:amidase n=1 Tax=Rhodococcus sp. NPDC056960 TaxID=3345982 RepID=UPI00363D6D7B